MRTRSVWHDTTITRTSNSNSICFSREDIIYSVQSHLRTNFCPQIGINSRQPMVLRTRLSTVLACHRKIGVGWVIGSMSKTQLRWEEIMTHKMTNLTIITSTTISRVGNMQLIFRLLIISSFLLPLVCADESGRDLEFLKLIMNS